MDPARWSVVRRTIEEALAFSGNERIRYLTEACGSDAELRAEVEELLRAEPADGSLALPNGAFARLALAATKAAVGGSRIGNYRIVRQIGYGGMGSVYEAEQDQPRRTVALKLMRPGLVSAASLRRFEFEAQVLARLRHPCIAQVFEAGTHRADATDPTSALPYFAMEFVPDAMSLTGFARARSLTVRERLELFVQVCDAVHHGHQKGVIHRDLKPGNILVDSDGRPRIIDFGVARTIEPDPAASATGEHVVGTLQYMSPEQCSLDSEGVDTRSDVYSLGVVLYELLAGHAPHDLSGQSISKALRIVREIEPPQLGSVDKSLSGDIETIVATAMHKDRVRRYAAASALAADVRRFLRFEAIAARPSTILYQLGSFARRNRALVGGMVAVFVVLVLGIVATSAALRTARLEAKRFRSIADYLGDTITSGNPYLPAGLVHTQRFWWDPPAIPAMDSQPPSAAPGREFSVADLVARAGDRLDTAFPDDPVTQGELLDTLGRTLWHLGRGAEGVVLLRRAVEARERALGPDHPDTIRSQIRLAETIEGSGDYASAEPIFRAAWEASRRTFGPTDPRAFEVAVRLASNLSWYRPADGLEFARRILEEAVRAYGEDDRSSLLAMVSLTAVLLSTGRNAEAQDNAQRALAAFRKTTGEDSLETARARAALGDALRRGGKFAEADENYRAAAVMLRKFLPAGIVDYEVFNAELGRINLLRRMGRSDDAAVELRRVLGEATASMGTASHTVHKLESQLARALLESGTSLEEAEQHARHALEGITAVLGKGDLNTTLAADTLNALICARGRPQEAEGPARELLRFAEAEGITEPTVLAALRHTLGQCLMNQGRLEEGRAQFLAAWSSLDHDANSEDPYDPRRVALIRDTVRLFEAQGDTERASEFRARSTPPPSHE